MHNVRLKNFGNGKKQYTIYLDTIVSTSDGLDKELEELRHKANNECLTDEQKIFYHEKFKETLGKIDQREELKINEEELEGEHLDFFLECKEKARLHSKLNNYKRAKNKIYDYARANQWEYFLTFTFSPEKADRSNYDEVKKKLTKWLNNISGRYCAGKLKYLVVPELHKDLKNWHFHGLLANCDGIIFEPSGLVDKQGRTIYNLPQYKLGFSTATKISSTEKASGYICKYVTKQLDIKLSGKRRYLISNNLNKPIEEKYYNGYIKEFQEELKNNENVVWWQQKNYKVLGEERSYIIVEIDENLEQSN